MLVKGRPLGIWVISALLMMAALSVIYLSRDEYRFELITAITIGLSGLFVCGLMLRMRWVYFALLLFLSMSVLLQLVAATLIFTAYIAADAIDWFQLTARYWQGAVSLVALCTTISYLCRGQARSYFFTDNKHH